MSIMDKIGKTVLAGIAALAINYGTARADANASGEVFANNNAVVGDAIASVDILPDECDLKMSYFMRDLVTTDYSGGVSNFLLHELNIGELAGIRAVGQARFVGTDLVPQAGLSVFQDVYGLGVYGAATLNVDGEPVVGELLLNLGYAFPGARENDAVKLELEQFGWFGKDVASGQTKVHVGYSIDDRVIVGPAVQANYGQNEDASVGVGGFVRVRGD